MKSAIVALLVVLPLTSAYAAGTPRSAAPPEWQVRATMQNEAIYEGAAEGALCWDEAAYLFEEQTAIQRRIDQLAADGGLDRADLKVIRFLQDEAGRNIARNRRDAETCEPARLSHALPPAPEAVN